MVSSERTYSLLTCQLTGIPLLAAIVALCFLGGVIALAYSDLILYFAILCNRHLPQGDSLPNETIGARLVCGFGLAIVALIGELLNCI